VEHPVTELVTGVDVAAKQIEIAAHRPLRIAQREVKLSGHAIECRINAEDPSAGFLPSPGRLARFEFPAELGPGRLRIDTHLTAGDVVSPHYDSLLAKVIAHAETRAGTIETLRRCLAGARIEGVKTTIPVHLAVLASREFQTGEYDTSAIPGWKG
jgi:acetyl-CoA carboxylase biotin carboxylase subunit